MDIWNRVLNAYSEANDLNFISPLPIGLIDIETDEPGVIMSYIPGYELKKFNRMKRNTPVKIKGQKYPLPLYPAFALHLGALDEIKDQEGLIHSDYAPRHVIFSPLNNVSIGVVDLENSHQDSSIKANLESEELFERFRTLTPSNRDKVALDAWHDEGRRSLIKPDHMLQLDRAIEEVRNIYHIDLDYKNFKLNGISLIS